MPQGRTAVARSPDRPPEARRRRTRKPSISPRCTASATRATRSAIAAAGAHHLLFVGPPGVGKTMLARRLPDDPSSAHARRGARSHARSTRPRARDPRPALPGPPVPRPAPQRVGGRARRRRQPAPGRARSRSRIVAHSSSTSWPSSRPRCSTRCASRSKSASCGSAARRAPSSSRPTSCWSRAATRARAVGSRPTAAAPTCSARGTCGGSRRRCSIGSTSGSGCTRRIPMRPPARRRPTSARAGRGRRRTAGAPARGDSLAAQRPHRRRCARGAGPAPARRRRVWRGRLPRPAPERPRRGTHPPRRPHASPTSTTAPRSAPTMSNTRARCVRTCSEPRRAHRPQVAAATLASLPRITPARLRRMFEQFGGPEAALAAVVAGAARRVCGARDQADAIASRWARTRRPDAIARCWRSGHARLDRRRRRLPDPRGRSPGDQPCCSAKVRARAFAAPRVAIVGTRTATPNGLADAREIGAFLAGAGVTVVSGLALGIDGAAHEGALAARRRTSSASSRPGSTSPIRAATTRCTRTCATHGLVVSEHAYGVQPHATQFPVRNRIIAALCDVCVVVEATATGGATHHRRLRERLRPHRVRAARRAPQPRRGRVQRADQGRRADPARSGRPPDRARRGSRRRTLAAAARSAFGPGRHARARGARRRTRDVDQLVGPHRDSHRPPRRRAPALEQSGHIERGRGRWWPR